MPAVRALMVRDREQRPIDDRLVAKLGDGRHLLVLDNAHGELIAAAMFSIANRHGHLHFLVVAQEADEAHALEQRMIAIIEAMCDAYGATTLDVPAHQAA